MAQTVSSQQQQQQQQQQNQPQQSIVMVQQPMSLIAVNHLPLKFYPSHQYVKNFKNSDNTCNISDELKISEKAIGPVNYCGLIV